MTTHYAHPYRHTAEGLTLTDDPRGGLLISSMTHTSRGGPYATRAHSISGDRAPCVLRVDPAAEMTSAAPTEAGLRARLARADDFAAREEIKDGLDRLTGGTWRQ
jgi:hypothetical protein